MIYIGADHRGFELKEELRQYLTKQGHGVEDVGAFELNEGDDYVDFAKGVAEKVSENPSENRGILLCGSGHGVDIVANKHKGIRAVLCWNKQVAKQSREHEDANVLVLPSDWISEHHAQEVIGAWLKTEFSGEERHVRRLEKIKELENDNYV